MSMSFVLYLHKQISHSFIDLHFARLTFNMRAIDRDVSNCVTTFAGVFAIVLMVLYNKCSMNMK